MPAPRWLARANRRVTNRLLEPLARHLPGFGVVLHTGRTTGRQYRTPVNVFSHSNVFVIALTYGRDSQWVRNVLAHGGCGLETRGRTYWLAHPRLFHDERRRSVPLPVRLALGVVHVDDFLELTLDDGAAEPAGFQHAAADR